MKITYTRLLLVFIFFLSFSGKIFSVTPDFYSTNSSGAVATGGCSPFNVTFHDASTGGTSNSWFWDFGDLGATSIDSNPQHNYAVPGYYTITLVVNGTDTITKTDYIRVFKNPIPSFSVSPDTICSGSSVTLLDTSIPGDTTINQWSWSFDDGSAPVTGVNSVTHTYNNVTLPLRIFFPSLIVNDLNGCSASTPASVDSVFVLQQPTALFSIGSVSSCTLPATIGFVNNSTLGPALYNWDFGDPTSGASNTSTQTSPSHTYNNAGDYLVTLTNGIPGCMAQDTMTVSITPPVASFIVDTIVCRNVPVTFTNTSIPPSATYRWTFGDFSPVNTTKDPTHTYTNPNVYTVTLTTSLGSCTSTATQTIRVPNPPSINFTSPDHAACDTPFAVTFNADTTSLNVGWEWTFGDPSSGASNNSSIRDPVHTYNSFGDYTVKLVVTDIFGCKDSVTLVDYVRVIKPVVDFSVVDSGCVGKIFNYNASVISPADPVITDYTWDFGDGTGPQSVTTPATTHQFNTVGIFDVTLTITTQSGCTATLTKTAYARVGTTPNATIDSTHQIICFKDEVTFTDLTPPPVTGWLWDFGDGGSSTEQNPSHQYDIDTSGTVDPFNVMMIAYYNGCPDTIEIVDMITVKGPIPFFDVIYNCSNPDSVFFQNLSGVVDTVYTWDFGDATALSNDTNPSHIYAGSGQYMVKLTAINNANGCVVDTTLPVQITNLSAVAASDSIQACHPATINFTGNGSVDAATWHWNFGDPLSGVLDSSSATDTLHVYSRTGTYLVQLTTTDIHSCVKVDTQQIHIIGPTAYFFADSLGGCSPVSVLFTDTSHTDGGAIAQRVWNFGTGGSLVPTLFDTITAVYNSPGLYTITLTTIDVNGCIDTYIATNYLNPTQPTAGIIMPDTGCSNSQLITGSAGPVGSYAPPATYNWDFGDTQSLSTTSNPINHDYSTNGSYTLKLIVVDNNGCRDTTQKSFFAYTTPAVFHYTSNDTCVVENGIKKAIVDGNFHSDSNSYVVNWHWNLTVIDEPVYPSPDYYHRYNVSPGSYDASLIVTNRWGCNDTALTPAAIVIPGPSGNFSFIPDSGCSPLTVDFTGHSFNSQTYAWDFGDGTVINGTSDSTVQHTYTTPNSYVPQFYLGFQLSNSFCYVPVPIYDTVKVTSFLGVNIVEDSIIIKEGETGLLHVVITDPIGVGPPYTYVWDPAAQITSGPGPNTFTASTTGQTQNYTLSVPYGATGCSGADKVLVIYVPCDEVSIDTIPNVFTPDNGDELNNTFHIKGLCNYDGFLIRIYNRWGKLIYESNDPEFEWNGKTSGGTDCSEGTYYYVLKGRTRDLHGYIDLIRNKK